MKIIYKILNKTYDQQGWWPISKNSLHPKHHNGPPKNDRDRFEIILGAVLTQNTNWNNVEKAIFNLNKAKVLSAEKINKIQIEKLAELIMPAGYYNQKAGTLKRMADYFLKTKLKEKNIEKLRKELLSIKGIGPETADSIILYAAELPIFVIDAYTKRIASRLGICKENIKYDDLQALFHKSLNPNTKLFNNFHAVLVEHAKVHCKKKPVCEKCPFLGRCSY